MLKNNESKSLVEWVIAEIKEETDNLSYGLLKGACKDFNDYSRIVGEINGLNKARDMVVDLFKRLVNDDEGE